MTFLELCASVLRTTQGRLGVALIGLCWPLNWALPGLRSAYLFFPLWLGYVLTVDALVFVRSGTSLAHRSLKAFGAHFLASAPAWWLFEVINRRTRNWEYLAAEQFTDLQYFLLCTISFSTVMPAVFETAELVRTFRWIDRLAAGVRVRLSPRLCVGLLVTGIAMLALMLAWPGSFYPLVWTSVFLILEPINVWLGNRHFGESLEHGDWRPMLSLSVGALICGFFWEFWNFYSFPKWIYHTPGVEFLHVFEMPLLGYGGYLFFAWELRALRDFVWPKAPRLRL